MMEVEIVKLMLAYMQLLLDTHTPPTLTVGCPYLEVWRPIARLMWFSNC